MALEPGEERVGRVVQGALAVRERRRPSVALVAVLGAGVVALVLLAALLLPAIRGGSPPGEPPAAVARFHVTNRNGVVVVQDADGGATFLYSRERPSEPPRGMRMIVRGGTRP
jgi:hypothetical protein